MNVDDLDKRRHRRRLSEDEHRLWRGITRSVAPLKRRRPVSAPADIPIPSGAAPPRPAVRRPADVATPRIAAPKPPASLAPIERRTKQRLARGSEPIDGRIDLHGRTQSEAYAALCSFLRRAQADGARFVLVITGKGASARDGTEERGILRRQVPLWLRLPELRPLVVAIEAAHRSHGGEGALYVRLRRSR